MYGFVYLVVLSGIGFLIYSFFIQPAPTCVDQRQNGKETGIDCGGDCVPCEIQALQPLAISKPLLFHNQNKIALLAELANTNLAYGSDQIRYRVNVYDQSNQVVTTFTNATFIYNGETKVIVETGIENRDNRIVRAEVIIEDTRWKSKSEWVQPQSTIGRLETLQQDDTAVIKSTIKNQNSFELPRVALLGIIKDKTGALIGASKTVLERLMPFEERTFQIFVPLDTTSATKVSIDPSGTNVVSEVRQ